MSALAFATVSWLMAIQANATELDDAAATPTAAETQALPAESPAERRPPDVLPEADEEMIVTAPAPVRGEVPSQRFMVDIYNAHSRGGRLYRQGRYEEAFPHLLAAAQHGFKMSQVRLGALYRFGLGGVKRNDFTAVAWMGMAAQGQSAPEVTRMYKRIRSAVSEQHLARIDAIIEDFSSKYSGEANRVSCEFHRQAGTYVKRLDCQFDDEYLYSDYDDLLGGLEPNQAPDPPPPPPPPQPPTP